MANKETHFADYLKKYCTPIVEEVLNGMRENRHRVGDMKPALVPKNPVLYRWWFPEKSPAMADICIALGKYPLNIDGNPAIGQKLQNYIMKERVLK